METKKVTFTTTSLKKFICPDGKSRKIYYDKKLPKLACLVSSRGVKTFALHTYDRLRKKTLQFTIGRYPEVSINEARDIAGSLLHQISCGVDIKEAALKIRSEPILSNRLQTFK